jgi:hypothetical protein
MSLTTDKFFYDALRGTSIDKACGGRIFNPARPTVDEDKDRIPYVVIFLESVANMSQTKDDIEGDTDSSSVVLLVVASDRQSLGELTTGIRRRIKEYWKSRPAEAPIDWEFRAGPVQYDVVKPCCFQELMYICLTDNTL